MWLYAHVKRQRAEQRDQMHDFVNLICAFINPSAAKDLFTEPVVVTNTGFLDDLKKIDPKFDASKYSELLEDPV
jgi:hypothetical protein